MSNFLKHKLIIVLITVLAFTSFFIIYNQTKAGELFLTSDTLSRQKISVAANHEIAFRLTLGTNVTENETITVSFASGFDTNLNGIDCGDIDLLDDSVQENLNNEAGGCVATATEWGASVAGGILTLTAPSTPGTYIDGSSDVIIDIGTNTSEEGIGNEQITNPATPGTYIIQIGGTFGDTKAIAVTFAANDQVNVSAEISSPGGPPPPLPPDTSPPVIFDLQVKNITQTSATITWQTNEGSTTLANYGLTISYEIGTATGVSFVTNHSIDLINLSADTLYHFRARSADLFGNEAVTDDQTFKTLGLPDLTAPIISNIQAVDITQSGATITWDTNELATSKVEYGLTTTYELGTSNSADLVLPHSMPLAGLTPNTLYHFRVSSTDAAGNEGVSDDQTFKTSESPDITPPVISNIQVINITETSGNVTWQTDEPSTSQVQYGLSNAYELGTLSSTDLVISHAIPLLGLTQNTLYHFQVSSTDAAGNTAISADQIFTTLPDLTPPANVSNFRATAGDSQISLSWTNPPDPDFAGVKILRKTENFPSGPTDGTLIYDGAGTSLVDPGLTNGVTYYYGTFSYDSAGNFASGALASATPTAPLPPPPPPVPPTPPTPPTPPSPGAPSTPSFPATPPVPIPPVTVSPEEKIDFSKIDFYTKDRTLKLSPNYSLKTVKAPISWPLAISLPVQNLPKTPKQIILTIGSSSYQLSLNSGGNAYEADFIAPSEVGKYGSLLLVFYADGSSDVIDFTFLIDPYGYVYEIAENKILPIEGATVTLYQLVGNKWQVWPADHFGQKNPESTTATGDYSFLVPPGTYYLKAEKKDYWPRETSRFEVKENIVNLNIELWHIPVLKPTLKSIGEIISFGTKVGGEAITKIIDNPQVEKVNEKVAAPAVAAIALLSYSTAISLANLLSYLQFLFTQPILLLFPKKRKGWGVVYNSLSKIPVDLAIVRLFEKTTGRLVQTRVTDREGRYAFLLQPGNYYIKVVKPNFSFPTYYIKDKKEDLKYLDIYHGEEVLVTEKNALITPNIPIDPVEVEKAMPDRKIIFTYFGRKLQNLIAITGIILTTGSVLISPKLWLLGILLAHCLLYGIFRRLAKPSRPKSWGIVYEKQTHAPVGRAIARIFEIEYNKLLETQVTDSRGRYSFLVGNNIYYVTFEKLGFQPKRTETLDLRKMEKGGAISLDVALEKT
jgi:hypothetical protein